MRRISAVPLLLVFVACSSGSDNDSGSVSDRASTLCADIRGMEAIAWDYYNGLLITDPVFPPPTPEVGGSYSHTDFPLLGFVYPPGWRTNELRDFGVQGVEVIRDDQGSIWRYVNITSQGVADVAAVRVAELAGARQFFEVSEELQLICSNRGSTERAPGTGIVTHYDNVLVRGSGRSVLLTAHVTQVPGLPSSSVFIRLLSSPSAEFADRLFDTFMALDWQLLIVDRNLTSDSDGDGWLDQFDSFPDDPNRH